MFTCLHEFCRSIYDQVCRTTVVDHKTTESSPEAISALEAKLAVVTVKARKLLKDNNALKRQLAQAQSTNAAHSDPGFLKYDESYEARVADLPATPPGRSSSPFGTPLAGGKRLFPSPSTDRVQHDGGHADDRATRAMLDPLEREVLALQHKLVTASNREKKLQAKLTKLNKEQTRRQLEVEENATLRVEVAALHDTTDGLRAELAATQSMRPALPQYIACTCYQRISTLHALSITGTPERCRKN
jgi:hypothetical protein